jgi:lysozyme
MRFQLLSMFSRALSPNKSEMTSLKSSELSASLPAPLPELSNNHDLITQMTKQLTIDEGEVLHAYQDHLGYLTIGVGRLIDKRKGGGITKEEAAYLLQNDINTRIDALQTKIPWVKELAQARQGVLVNMSFQLGVDGLLKFTRTLAYIQAGDYAAAADNMLKSKWAAQTPLRAERMAKQMRTGKWQFGY